MRNYALLIMTGCFFGEPLPGSSGPTDNTFKVDGIDDEEIADVHLPAIVYADPDLDMKPAVRNLWFILWSARVPTQ